MSQDSPTPPELQKDELLRQVAFRVYRAGIIVSAILIIAGLALEWAGGLGWKWLQMQRKYYSWPSLETILIFSGLLCLAVTPLARVGATLLFSIRQREWILVLLASVVLLLVLVSMIISWSS